MKKAIALCMGILMIGMSASNVAAETEPIENVWNVESEEFKSQEKQVCKWIREDFGKIKVYGTDELPEKNVRGITVVERSVGICLDDDGNGMILDTKNREFDYISYRNLGIEKGEVIVTYCVYNPETEEIEDDILDRYDIGIR